MLLRTEIITECLTSQGLVWETMLFRTTPLTHIYAYDPRHLKVNVRARVCTTYAPASRHMTSPYNPVSVACYKKLFGSRSTEGVHPAYVVNTLTILHEANGNVSVHTLLPSTFHRSDEERQMRASAYATTTCEHVVKKLHF